MIDEKENRKRSSPMTINPEVRFTALPYGMSNAIGDILLMPTTGISRREMLEFLADHHCAAHNPTQTDWRKYYLPVYLAKKAEYLSNG